MIQGLIVAGMLGLTAVTGPQDPDDPPYFPRSLQESTVSCGIAGLGGRRAAMSSFVADWYGGHLRAAGEVPLFDKPGPTLRFTWLRTFDAPVVVRLDTAVDGTVTLIATELSGQGGYAPGVVARRVERRLSAEEAATVAQVLADTDVLAQTPKTCDLGMDGSQWIVESAGPHGYRFVDRWTPRSGPVRDLGLHLIGLTGWTYDRIY